MQARQLSSIAIPSLDSRGHLSIAEGPGLAHDAGNLLGALGLYCDLLNMPGVLRPEHLHYAHELKLLSQRSGELIHRLLSRCPDAALPAHPPVVRHLNPGAAIRSFVPLLRSVAAPHATVSLSAAPSLPALPYPAEVLERVLVNLTRNAAAAIHLRASSDGEENPVAGRIRIAVYGNARHFGLTVADNGHGMSPEMAAAFLKPSPLPPGAVNGLGHRIVHELLESTGGQLAISVVPGGGTTLQIDWMISSGRLSRLGKTTRREGTTLSC